MSSGYRNGRLIYPVSVIDHIKAGQDPIQEDVDALKEFVGEQQTVNPDDVIKGIAEIEKFLEGTSDDTTLKNILKKDIGFMYVGTGQEPKDVMLEENKVSSAYEHIPIAAANNYIYAICPSSGVYSQNIGVIMNGLTVPMRKVYQTIEGVDYTIYKSQSAYIFTGEIMVTVSVPKEEN